MGRKKTARAGGAGPRRASAPKRRPTSSSEVARLRARAAELEAALPARTQTEGVLPASEGRAAEALRRSEARALALFEAASEGIVIVAPDGRIVSVNAKTEELFGYSRRELVGKRVEMLLPERSQRTRRRAVDPGKGHDLHPHLPGSSRPRALNGGSTRPRRERSPRPRPGCALAALTAVPAFRRRAFCLLPLRGSACGTARRSGQGPRGHRRRRGADAGRWAWGRPRPPRQRPPRAP
jgi:PAS domain-containing protein